MVEDGAMIGTTRDDRPQAGEHDSATGATGPCALAPGGPYFLARMRSGRVETHGQIAAEFGHKIAAVHAVPDGIFAGWHWDGTRLTVRNDRYGFYPLFWFRPADGGICVSPSLTKLVELGAPVELDTDALAVFFRLGYFLDNDTPFSAIRTVPPNAVFEWERGDLKCQARYPQAAKASSIKRDDAIDGYIELFAQAMARRTPASGKFAVPISGGRDSRHILLELHRTGFRPEVCVSAMDYPPDPNQDAQIAKSLCAELGFNHAVVDQPLSLLQAELRKNVETNFCSSAHAWYLALADFLNGRFDGMYDGIAGDVLSQSSFLDADILAAFQSRNAREAATALLAKHAVKHATLRGILKGKLLRALEPEIAINRLCREIEHHFDALNPVGSFIFWNRTRREIALAPYSLVHGIPNVFSPYLDHDVFDFLTTLPVSMLVDRTFHSDAIARAYPAYAHVPYADKHAPHTDDSELRARFLTELAGRFVLRKPSSLMNNVVPRAKMFAGLMFGGRLRPWLSPLIVYLDQLECLIDHYRAG